MIKLDLVTEETKKPSRPEPESTEIVTATREIVTTSDQTAGASLFEAMRGALRRTDRVDLSGFGFFFIRPRHRAQQTMSLLSTIFETSTDAVITTALDGKIVSWNRGAEAMFGRDADEVAGLSVSMLSPDPNESELLAALSRLKRGSQTEELETRCVAKDGSSLTVHLTVCPIQDKKGRPTAAGLIARDVTERRQVEQELRKSEEWFHTLVEHTADLLVVLERDGRVRYANGSLRRLLGYKLRDVAGRRPIEWLHPEDLDAISRATNKFSRFDPDGMIRLRLKHADGTWRTFEATARNLQDNDAVAGIVVTARDISDRIRTEQQVRQAYAQEQRMNAAESLAGVISRDLDNLLTTISGYSSLIIRQLESSHYEEPTVHARVTETRDRLLTDAHQVQKAAEQAARITESLLAFSQKQVLRPRVLDLNSLLSELDPRIRELVGAHITVLRVADPDLGRIRVDRAWLEHAILGIAINAREAMPSSGTLTIETKSVDLGNESRTQIRGLEPGRFVTLEIRDSGRGMDAETQTHVFEPFFTTRESGSGKGLGMSMAYGIIKQSGGHIDIRSEQGVGTAVRVFFPLSDAMSETVAIAEESDLPRGSETVLLLQPDEAVRGLARQILVMSGYAVLEARNEMEALQLCQTHPAPIELLVADPAPASRASEVTSRLLALRPEMGLLYTCGYAEGLALQESQDEPTWGYVQKPFSPASLAQKAREVLDATPRVKARSA
ncbi:MAG TPA: PAS domain S-box protein [Blastocatellia bacterium]|nr:PAS domain S-box protein [Blastocatellia bacterium]